MNKKHIVRAILSLFIIVLGLSTSAGGGGVRWKTIRVDTGHTFRHVTNGSLKLYDGIPNVAYGSDHLYYAVLDGGNFKNTTVDDEWGVGMFASLALDPSNGHPRISYYDQTNNHLKYAEQNANGLLHSWSITTIDASGEVGGNKTAIALDNSSSHLPHIAYTNLNGHVWHAWKTCTGTPPFQICTWHTEEVDGTVNTAGDNITLAIDADGYLHLAYYDSITSSLRYALYNGAWYFDTLSDNTGVFSFGMEPSLAIDSSGWPAITYETDSGINYAWRASDTWADWDFDIVYEDTSASEVPSAPSLQLPNEDLSQPWISFIDGNSEVELATSGDNTCPGTTGSYDCTYVDDSSDFHVTSLAVDTSNPAYNLSRVITIDALTGELRYEYQDTSYIWHSLAVDYSTNVGLYSSLVVNPDGPHIGYYDQDATRFKYAEYDDSDPGGCGDFNSTDQYRCETVVNTGDLPASVDIGISSNGYPHMALYDPTFPVLQFATLTSTWISSMIDNSSADVGRYASLEFSPLTGGRPVIAYLDSANGWLKLAQEFENPTGTGCVTPYWQCEKIEAIDTDGFGISLALGYDYIPLISYVDGSDHQVKLARWRGAGVGGGNCDFNTYWDCDPIAPGHPTYEGETSIWADPGSARIMVSFYDSVNDWLMITSTDDGINWWPGVADYTPASGSDNSLTVIGNMPVIAYVNDGEKDLMLTSQVGGGNGNCGDMANWYCQVLDADGWVGYSPSIQNVSGRLYISYYDWTNGDLKLIYQAFPLFAPIIRKP